MKIDSTQLKCFASCPMQYKLNYVDCLKKSEYEEDSVDIRFGECIHSALEEFDENRQITQNMVNKFDKEFVDLPGEEVKTLQHGKLLLQNFVPYYLANFNEWKTLEKENVGVVSIDDIQYLVKTDRVIEWRGNIYVVDFKTVNAKYKYGFFDKFQLDWQPTGYVEWCKQKYGQCSGFIPVGMFVGYRKKMYKGEPAGFHCMFDYTIVNRTKEDIDLWKKDVRLICNRIKQCHVTGNWHRNTSFCSSYRGCQYMQACLSGYDEMVLNTLYQKFNPNEYLEGGSNC